MIKTHQKKIQNKLNLTPKSYNKIIYLGIKEHYKHEFNDFQLDLTNQNLPLRRK
jgi:hypothetical protein